MKRLQQIYETTYLNDLYSAVLNRVDVKLKYSREDFLNWLKKDIAESTGIPLEDIRPEDIRAHLHGWLYEELEDMIYQPYVTKPMRDIMAEEGITEEVIDRWLLYVGKVMNKELRDKEIEKGCKEAGANLDF